MKTIIATFIISILSSINMDLGATDYYKNVEVDNDKNTITTYVYEGSKSKKSVYLTPYKKYIVKSDENGESLQKTIYRWDDTKEEWMESVKYEYFYTLSGDLSYLSYNKWDESSLNWEADVQYAMYIYSREGDLLTINQ